MVAKYARTASRLSAWLEENIPEGLTVFDFPKEHWRRLRTTNNLERVSQEIKRRTRVVRIFPNEAACLRLVSAILMEISEEWETGYNRKLWIGMIKKGGVSFGRLNPRPA